MSNYEIDCFGNVYKTFLNGFIRIHFEEWKVEELKERFERDTKRIKDANKIPISKLKELLKEKGAKYIDVSDTDDEWSHYEYKGHEISYREMWNEPALFSLDNENINIFELLDLIRDDFK
jgi:hypothetical protein